MDDLLCSTPSIKEAIQLREDLTNLFKSSGMTIRKWLSNSKEVLQDIPEEILNTDVDLSNSILPSTKTLGALGVSWNSSKDILYFNFSSQSE